MAKFHFGSKSHIALVKSPGSPLPAIKTGGVTIPTLQPQPEPTVAVKEVIVDRPVEVIKQVQVIKEVPVEIVRYVDRIVEKPVEVIKEVIKEVRVEIPKEIQVIKEITKEVQVEVIKEVRIPVITSVYKTPRWAWAAVMVMVAELAIILHFVINK